MLRRANKEDLETIVDLKLKMFKEVGIIELVGANIAEIIWETYKNHYNSGIAVHYLIQQDGRIVACAGAFLKNDIPFCFYSNPVYGFIGDVYTLPEYRRKGHARKVTIEALAWLRNKGVNMVRLLASEQARHMYEQIGFTMSDEMVMKI